MSQHNNSRPYSCSRGASHKSYPVHFIHGVSPCPATTWDEQYLDGNEELSCSACNTELHASQPDTYGYLDGGEIVCAECALAVHNMERGKI